MNVLVTNIGRRNYLIEFFNEIKSSEDKIYVTDCDVSAGALYGKNDGCYILPKPVDNPKIYIDELIKMCEKLSIDLIIPVIDPEIYILSKFKKLFIEKGICVLVSDSNVLDICYNKKFMNQFLEKNGFLVPKTYYDLSSFIQDFEKDEIKFPVFLKCIWGSGSVDASIINNMKELEIKFKEGMMIQEFLCGKEFGVDLFFNEKNEVVRSVLKKKLLMRSGETDKSITVKNKIDQAYTIKLGNAIKGYGPCDCDFIKTEKGIYFIDINPRFGGGYPATHMSGVNFIELAMKLSKKIKIEKDFNTYKSDILTMKVVGITTKECKKI